MNDRGLSVHDPQYFRRGGTGILDAVRHRAAKLEAIAFGQALATLAYGQLDFALEHHAGFFPRPQQDFFRAGIGWDGDDHEL